MNGSYCGCSNLFGTGNWQLYDISKDPGEINDVSDDHPNTKVMQIEAWQAYAKKNEVYDHKGRFDALYRKACAKN